MKIGFQSRIGNPNGFEMEFEFKGIQMNLNIRNSNGVENEFEY